MDARPMRRSLGETGIAVGILLMVFGGADLTLLHLLHSWTAWFGVMGAGFLLLCAGVIGTGESP